MNINISLDSILKHPTRTPAKVRIRYSDRPISPWYHVRLTKWRRWSTCDVGEATSEGLENEQSLIRQPFHLPFRRFTYVTAHSPILPASLHICHRHFIYVTWRAVHACYRSTFFKLELIKFSCHLPYTILLLFYYTTVIYYI